MGAFSQAIAALAGLNVAGVRNHFGVDALPDDVKRGQLPALLILPYGGDKGALRREDRGEGFRTMAFSGGEHTVTYTVTHLLAVAPAESGDIRHHLPTLIDLVDAYFAALSINPTLGGTLVVPAKVRVEIGTFTHGSASYFGCALRHTWEVAL